MVELALAVPIRVINAIVNDPELVGVGGNVDTRHHPNPFDNGVGIAAVLPSHQFDLDRTLVIQHGVVERQVAACTPDDLSAHVFPHHPCREFILLQVAFHRIMAETGAVVGEIGHGVVGLAHQQKLTIIQSCDFVHALSLSSRSFFRLFA